MSGSRRDGRPDHPAWSAPLRDKLHYLKTSIAASGFVKHSERSTRR
jgi:hypothetical protein